MADRLRELLYPLAILTIVASLWATAWSRNLTERAKIDSMPTRAIQSANQPQMAVR